MQLKLYTFILLRKTSTYIVFHIEIPVNFVGSNRPIELLTLGTVIWWKFASYNRFTVEETGQTFQMKPVNRLIIRDED